MLTINDGRRPLLGVAISLGLALCTAACTAGSDARASEERRVVRASEPPTATTDAPPPAPSGAPTTPDDAPNPAVEEACAILARMAAEEAAAVGLDGDGDLEQPLHDHGVRLQELARHLQATGGAQELSRVTELGTTGTFVQAFAGDLLAHRTAGTEPPPVLLTEAGKMLERLSDLMYDLRLWEAQICEEPAGSTVTWVEIDGSPHAFVDPHPSPWLLPRDD